jgi:hypothetical protein
MNSNILNNPIIHGIVAFLVFGLGWFISSGNPLLTLTIGAVLKSLYTWAASYAN